MTHSSKMFILVVCFAVVFLFSGCQSAPLSEVTESSRGTAARAVVEASNEFKPHVIRAVPAKRPSWVDMVPRTDDFVYFVGASNDCSSESDARDRARENAAKQVASYLGTVIKNTAQGKKSIKSISDTELKMTVEQEELLQSFAERYVTQIQTDNYYTEQWQLTQKETGYRSWALCSISKAMAEDEINTFAGKISEQFIALLPENQPGKYSSVQSAVEAYISVFRDITANPIYQAVIIRPFVRGKK